MIFLTICAGLDESEIREYRPNSPLLPCQWLSDEFVECAVSDLTQMSDLDYDGLSAPLGCRRFGPPSSDSAPLTTNATCTVAQNVTCLGPRTFVRTGFPCLRFDGYRYPTALLLSFFLGFFGADRFYLGYIFVGVIKLVTVGGFGAWYLIDLFLLAAGRLGPANGSSWDIVW